MKKSISRRAVTLVLTLAMLAGIMPASAVALKGDALDQNNAVESVVEEGPITMGPSEADFPVTEETELTEEIPAELPVMELPVVDDILVEGFESIEDFESFLEKEIVEDEIIENEIIEDEIIEDEIIEDEIIEDEIIEDEEIAEDEEIIEDEEIAEGEEIIEDEEIAEGDEIIDDEEIAEDDEIIEDEEIAEDEIIEDEEIAEDEEVIEDEEIAEDEEEKVYFDDETVEVYIYPEMTLFGGADTKAGMEVSVGRNMVTITISGVGEEGTAKLYRYDANEYFPGDPLYGMSKDITGQGELICEYPCGKTAEVTFDRYKISGEDNLYAKYYLVQDGEILVGPIYATDIHSVRSIAPFEQATKKGLTLEDESTIDLALEMGASNTVINMDLCTLIITNEDENGNPVDNSRRSDVIEFESNGETFYFNADYVALQDRLISQYSRNGINVTLILIAWAKTWTDDYPDPLMYLDKASDNRQTMAFNTSTERGRAYWTAAMEFMASRYSVSANRGLVNKYVIGNEIDYTYDWYLLEPLKVNGKYNRTEFNTFMEEYARTFRLANMAVKKSNSEAKVLISFTHNWAVNCYDSYNCNGEQIRYVSYAPKKILDWMNVYEKGRGDYDWGLAVHPYPVGTDASKPTYSEPNLKGTLGQADPITGRLTSPWITASNLELYQLYLEQPEARYNGETRSVSITEACICSLNEKTYDPEVYKRSTYEQAASVAQYYYRAACIDVIEDIAYFQPHDQSTYKLGLMTQRGVIKPVYSVWKYVDTNKTFNYANKYLKYIDPSYIEKGVAKYTSYEEVMPVVSSAFDWEKNWDLDKIMVRSIATSDVNRTVATNKDSYAAGDAILVTATGDEGDIVGLYKATDDPASTEAIYSYPVVGSSKGLTFKSGATYDLLAYGNINASRYSEAALTAGNYKIVLLRGDTGETVQKNIKISGNYPFGSTVPTLTTNKDTYSAGEDIIVTATGNPAGWVGLYGVNDRYGTGATTSIYWYYINDTGHGTITGKPVVLQTTVHNTDSSNPSARIAPGEYILYLFHDGGYTKVAEKRITVTAIDMAPLTSVEYKLDNEADGFANGTVTVKKDAANINATDCVMYWADANGQPLAGYTALAKFKLTGEKTVHHMPTHTVIPEGAKMLIAYASDGASISQTAVSTALPANCTYDLDEKPLVEFQVITDIHVTTDSGATGEVKLANQHFTMMLEDVKKNSPDSIGIFTSGDNANTGSESEYLKIYDLYYRSVAAGGGDLPDLHMAIGNHDWMAGNPSGQFQKYVKMFNSNLAKQLENVYYDEELNGYNFIYLGGERAGLRANLSPEQIEWFDQRMAEITKEDPDKPVFVFLHQAFFNTVAGSLPGQGWDGVVNESSLKKVMKKYGQIILINGHGHWELNSESNMFPGGEDLPVAMNGASVGYLWSSYNVLGGEFADGSHGFYVRVYDDKVVFLGRDFENGLFIPSATFVLQKNKITTPANVYSISLDGGSVNLEAATAVNGGEITYAISNTEIASITEDGTLIPKKPGEVEVIITSYGTDTTVLDRKTVLVRIGDASAYRIYGTSRFDTAMKVSDELKDVMGVEKFDAVIVTDGMNFADALSGSYLAAKKNAPILIVNAANEDKIKRYVRANLNPGGTIYILGGTLAVPASFGNDMDGFFTRRLQGTSRYDTNLEILKEAGVGDDEILICTGTNYADSLSVSATGKPILLVGKSLTEAQKTFLSGTSGKFVIIGGNMAINESIENELKNFGTVQRLYGTSRYDTSVEVAKHFFGSPERMILAYGLNFPDGLSGGPLAYAQDAPLVLTAPYKEAAAQAYAKENGITNGSVLGGTMLIDDPVVRKIFGLGNQTPIVVK